MIPFIYNDNNSTLVIDERIGEFDGMLQYRNFNIIVVDKDNPQPLDLKKNGIRIKYDGRKQTVKI